MLIAENTSGKRRDDDTTAPYETFHAEVEEREGKFKGVLFQLSNAVLVFFYEDDMKLGTLAVAMPQFGAKTCISSILLGERNTIITKILAERIASTFNGIALVSLHAPEIRERETSSVLLTLTKQLLNKTDFK